MCRHSQLRIPKKPRSSTEHNSNLELLKINLANSVSHFQFLFSEKSCTPSRYLWIGTIFCNSVKGFEPSQHLIIILNTYVTELGPESL